MSDRTVIALYCVIVWPFFLASICFNVRGFGLGVLIIVAAFGLLFLGLRRRADKLLNG